jgi:hypothetical protein
MNKFTNIALAALMTVSGAGFAIAQDANTSLDSLTTSLTDQTPSEALDALGGANQVTIVKISGMTGDMDKFKAAMTADAADMASIAAVVSTNQPVRAQLEGAGIKPEQIVAVSVSGDKSVTLYINDAA